MSSQNKHNLGKRDRRIIIQEPVITDGSANSDIVNYRDYKRVWAFMSEAVVHGGERYSSDRLTAYQKTIFNIRFRGDLNTRMRIIWSDVIYQITGFNSNNRRGELDIITQLWDEEYSITADNTLITVDDTSITVDHD